MVSGENADPDYFGRDTGDASLDDSLNQDGIGENEILVVSFGTSFNDSRVKNFSMEEMAQGIAFAHAHHVKVYVTANILAHNYDLEGPRCLP